MVRLFLILSICQPSLMYIHVCSLFLALLLVCFLTLPLQYSIVCFAVQQLLKNLTKTYHKALRIPLNQKDQCLPHYLGLKKINYQTSRELLMIWSQRGLFVEKKTDGERESSVLKMIRVPDSKCARQKSAHQLKFEISSKCLSNCQ